MTTREVLQQPKGIRVVETNRFRFCTTRVFGTPIQEIYADNLGQALIISMLTSQNASSATSKWLIIDAHMSSPPLRQRLATLIMLWIDTRLSPNTVLKLAKFVSYTDADVG